MEIDNKINEFDVIAVHLGGTVTKHMEAVRLVQSLSVAGFCIVKYSYIEELEKQLEDLKAIASW